MSLIPNGIRLKKRKVSSEKSPSICVCKCHVWCFFKTYKTFKVLKYCQRVRLNQLLSSVVITESDILRAVSIAKCYQTFAT